MPVSAPPPPPGPGPTSFASVGKVNTTWELQSPKLSEDEAGRAFTEARTRDLRALRAATKTLADINFRHRSQLFARLRILETKVNQLIDVGRRHETPVAVQFRASHTVLRSRAEALESRAKAAEDRATRLETRVAALERQLQGKQSSQILIDLRDVEGQMEAEKPSGLKSLVDSHGHG